MMRMRALIRSRKRKENNERLDIELDNLRLRAAILDIAMISAGVREGINEPQCCLDDIEERMRLALSVTRQWPELMPRKLSRLYAELDWVNEEYLGNWTKRWVREQRVRISDLFFHFRHPPSGIGVYVARRFAGKKQLAEIQKKLCERLSTPCKCEGEILLYENKW